MNGLLSGAMIGGLFGLWSAMQTNIAMNRGHLSLHGTNLAIVLISVAIVAIAGGVVGLGIANII
jgi:hypothetical protein